MHDRSCGFSGRPWHGGSAVAPAILFVAALVVNILPRSRHPRLESRRAVRRPVIDYLITAALRKLRRKFRATRMLSFESAAFLPALIFLCLAGKPRKYLGFRL